MGNNLTKKYRKKGRGKKNNGNSSETERLPQRCCMFNETREIFANLKGLQTQMQDEVLSEYLLNPVTYLYNPHASDKELMPKIHIVKDECSEEQFPPSSVPSSLVRVQLPGNYPFFLKDYINNEQGMKLKLILGNIPQRRSLHEMIPEAVHLMTKLRFIRMWFIYKDGQEYPTVSLEESHGNAVRKMLKIHTRRPMYPRLIIQKNSKYLIIIGKGFMLRLGPPAENLTAREDYPLEDSNGEIPTAAGTYTRILDCREVFSVEWNVCLWDWYNQ